MIKYYLVFNANRTFFIAFTDERFSFMTDFYFVVNVMILF